MMKEFMMYIDLYLILVNILEYIPNFWMSLLARNRIFNEKEEHT